MSTTKRQISPIGAYLMINQPPNMQQQEYLNLPHCVHIHSHHHQHHTRRTRKASNKLLRLLSEREKETGSERSKLLAKYFA